MADPICWQCEHIRRNMLNQAWCVAPHKGRPEVERCPSFQARRTWGVALCPLCRARLGVERDGAGRPWAVCVVCPEEHRWRLRKSRGWRQCPACGAEHATFGVEMAGCRVVYHLCPRCGWGTRRYRRSGAPVGRGHGGQRWSPATGRPLVR